MPLSSVLVVIGIVSVFAVFGIALAWGERQTRHLQRNKAVIAPAHNPLELKRAA